MRLGRLLAVLLLGTVSVACTGAPSRGGEARDINDRVASMPGVSSVRMTYDNGILEGTRFELDVSMYTATDEQVGAVAAEIDAMRGDDFAEYNQRFTLRVADGTSIVFSARLPEDVERLAGQVRRLRAETAVGTVDFLPSANPARLTIDDAADPSAAVDAAIRVFGDALPDTLDVSAADRVSSPHWMTFTRLTVADKQRIDRQLAAAQPARPGWISVRDGRIERLTIGLPRPATAYDDLVRTIGAVEAGPEHPLYLTWTWRDDPAKYKEPEWAGTATIGGCETSEARLLVPEALAVQQRIRDEFGTCPK